MADYNKPALVEAHAKAQQLVPGAKIELIVRPNIPSPSNSPDAFKLMRDG